MTVTLNAGHLRALRKVAEGHLADNPDAFQSSGAPCGGHHVNAFRKTRFVSEKMHLGNPEAKIKNKQTVIKYNAV